MDADTLAAYAAQGWGQRRIGFGHRPALVIVDMQNDFVDPASPSTCSPMARDRLPVIRRLLDAARTSAIPVAFTMGVVEPDLSDVGLWKGTAKQAGQCQVRGTRGVEIVEELAPRHRERIVEKRRPSAFFETDLHTWLQEQDVDTLVLAGASMSGCVRATATDGFSHDYRVAIVRECVVDRSQHVLDSNLFDVHAKYADDVTLDEVLTYLAAP